MYGDVLDFNRREYNLYEFMSVNYKEKNKEDRLALQEA